MVYKFVFCGGEDSKAEERFSGHIYSLVCDSQTERCSQLLNKRSTPNHNP
jgi:hypothetical protein